MSSAIKRPNPINEEINFNIEELFFSTTDLVGTILSGNNIFVEISKYSEKELIGSPHNIIRHPDMPKLIFKVLWDYIKAGKPVSAYVKNLAKDGRYYWVLATVFPIPDGYLSIRIKPTTAIFKLIPDVYAQLLQVEKEKDVDAALKLLLEIINSKGFETYDAFFLTALKEELNARNKVMNKSTTSSRLLYSANYKLTFLEMLLKVSEETKDITSIFNKLFLRIENFLELCAMLEENSKFIINLSQQIFHLAMNANVESFRAGVMGASLAVLAKEIQVRSDDMKDVSNKILNISTEYSQDSNKQILEIAFQIAAPKLQIEMINSFIAELIAQQKDKKISLENVDVMQTNGMILLQLLKTYISQMMQQLRPLKKQLIELNNYIESMKVTIRELEMTKISGTIESASIGDMGETFKIVFEDMGKLNATAKEKLEVFQSDVKNVLFFIEEMISSEPHINDLLYSIEPTIKNMSESFAATLQEQ